MDLESLSQNQRFIYVQTTSESYHIKVAPSVTVLLLLGIWKWKRHRSILYSSPEQ